MSKVTIGIILTLLVLGLLPFALIARSRASQYDALPPHLVYDMDKQPKFKAQRATPMFADGRSMRPQVENTVAREDMAIATELLNDPMNPRPVNALPEGRASMLISDPVAYAGIVLGRVRPANMTDEQFNAHKPPVGNDQAIAGDTTFYLQRIPPQITVNADLLKRGQERFNIYCAPCHGESGYGDGMIANRADQLAVVPNAIGTWVVPQNLHEDRIRTRPDGHLFNTITHGIRNMPAYDKQISVLDRWAIVAYTRALQVSQNAPITGN